MSVSLSGRHQAQIALITAAAVGLFVVVRRLPTGTNLSHMDFRVTGGNSIEFCDPANPAFIPVVAVKSPVTMALAMDAPPAPGRPLHVTVELRTTSGKPIAPEDLLTVHEHRLHLMVVDPSLRDYEHLHPVPGRRPGAWDVIITPRRAGLYRVFGDFTPVATGRGLYASAEFIVPGTPDRAPAEDNWSWEADGLRFLLAPGAALRARQMVDLKLTVEATQEGRTVALEPVMGAYAHLVAFDRDRSGFAHIHPSQAGLEQRLDDRRPQLAFRVQIPWAGRYVIWSQVKVGGQERFAPFWIQVAP
ncbi:MAG TPA: hypothetical protein VLT83_14910 [Opitutaceae bacterium]|nr:hypothetical protein [Opitutaceae bacterium]